jgi:hypothetical protein
MTEPGRLVSELDHVQHERFDPGGLVHSGVEVRKGKLLGVEFEGSSTVVTATG